jgi:hypothetical protein
VGTENGVYATTDGGKGWFELTGGLPTIAVRDLEIQAREHDLIIGTFGRGIWILDDYSALRGDAATLSEEAATLFPIRDALQYIPGDKWGGRRNSHHGAGWWQAENPPFGALITYHLRDGYQSAAKRRRKAEMAAEKAGEDTPYPSWDDLRAEDREEAPSVELTIRDAAGEVVRRMAVPAGKGLHRVAWDLRYRHPDPAGEKDDRHSNEPADGLLALPGEYTAELHARVDGELMAIAGPESFTVNELVLSTEVADDRAAVLAFQQQTARLIGQIDAAREHLSSLEDNLELLDAAFRDAPAATEALRQSVRVLQARRMDLAVRMNGDRSVSSRNEATPLGIRARANRVRRDGWGSRAAVGGQQREQLAIAERQFDAFMGDMQSLIEDYEALAEQATALGAPWSPGRMPR